MSDVSYTESTVQDGIDVDLHDIDVKAPSRDGIPAANLSVLRGRGPRRGNLEDLLDYWRPIMKRKGGFRRCLVILADHPELYPLEPLCAWLHHETTGLWPNEGNHHGGGKKPRKPKKPGRRRRRRGKKSDSISLVNDSFSESRDRDGLLSQPISGRSNVVAFKASLYRSMMLEQEELKVGFVTSRSGLGRAAQSAGSFVVPGDLGDVRKPIRSTIYETLTPGGSGRRRRGRGGLPRVGRGEGEAVRNKFRCPPGFEKGGTFTNSSFTTCGRQILDIPLNTGKVSPGSLSPAAEKRVRRLARDASLVRSIGDLRENRSAFDIVRAAQIPSAPKEVNTKGRQSSVDLILSAFDGSKEAPEARFVRRDGIILRPAVPLSVLNELGEFDDMNDGVLVVSDLSREAGEQIGRDEVPAMVTGLRATVFNVPGVGSFSVRRVGGDLDDAERAGLNRSWAAALNAVKDVEDPTAAVRKFVADSDGRYALDQNIGEDAVDRELVTVRRGSRKITVPRWVFSTYLSREAPRRSDDQPPYTLVEDGAEAKALSIYAVKSQVKLRPDVDEFYAPYFGLVKSHVSDFVDVVEVKGRARSFFDPNIDRFRCPSGTSNGGQITDKFGRNCGAAIAGRLVDNLLRAGKRLGIDGPGDPDGGASPAAAVTPGRRRRVPGDSSKFDAAMAAAGRDLGKTRSNLREAVNKVRGAIDAAQKGRGKRGRIGASLGDRQERVDLSPDQIEALRGVEFNEALADLADLLDDVAYADAPEDVAQEVFRDVEKAATTEAGRLEVAPAKDRDAIRLRGDIEEKLGRLIGRVDAPAKEKLPDRGKPQRNVLGGARDRVAAGRERAAGVRDRVAARADVVLRPRRDPVPVPEFANLDDAQRRKVIAAMDRELADLDDIWKSRLNLAVEDVAEADDIREFVRARKAQGGDKRQIARLERERDDWLELLDATDPDREGDLDIEDVVGRLAEPRRQGVFNAADLRFESNRERLRQARLIREQQVANDKRKLDRERAARRDNRRRGIRRVLGGERGNKTDGDLIHPAAQPFNPDYKGDSLGPRNEHGFVYGPNVPVGNADINDVDQAVAHLNNGGAIADVPDEFVGRAIFANSNFDGSKRTSASNKRFQLISKVKGDGTPEGGVNGMFRFEDTVADNYIGIKFGQGEGGGGFGFNEAYSEVLGAHLGERLGILQGQVRFDGPQAPGSFRREGHDYTPTPIILVDLGHNVVPRADGVEKKRALQTPGDYEGNSRIKNSDKLHVDDATRFSLLDFIQTNSDRHGGNFFTYPDPDDPNVNRIYPIDNGLAFQGFSRTGDQHEVVGQEIPEQYKKWGGSYAGGRRNDILGGIATGRYGSREEVVAAIAKTQEDMRRADEKLSFGDSIEEIVGLAPDGIDDSEDGFYVAIQAAQDRYDWLLDSDPEEVYDAMTSHAVVRNRRGR